MGIHSKVWGQYLWRLLHTLTYSYNTKMPDELKGKYIRFFHVLKDFIPCPICRNHYTQRMTKNPPENNMKTTDDFVSWLNNLHNEVNAGLGKPLVSKKYADTYYIKNGQLTYDFKDFVILFRILTMMKYVNYPALKKFLELLYEIYPDNYLSKYSPKSQKTIHTIYDASSLNIWIIEFDIEFAKNRKTKSYLNIEHKEPEQTHNETKQTESVPKLKEITPIVNREPSNLSQENSFKYNSKIVKSEIDEFLKKYKII